MAKATDIKIDLSEQELAYITSVLHKFLPNSTVYIFGSRVNGLSKPTSDVDICVKNNEYPISLAELGAVREEFDQSNLSFLVDISDFFYLPMESQKTVLKEGVELL